MTRLLILAGALAFTAGLLLPNNGSLVLAAVVVLAGGLGVLAA